MKRRIFLIIICVLIVCVSTVVGVNTVKRSPFDKITPDNVSAVEYYICYFDNGESVWSEVPDENIDEFCRLINDIEITGFGSDYHKTLNGGTNIMFRVTMKDGSIKEFAACNPGMIIDDKYYESVYEKTNALDRFWAELVPLGRAEYGL